MSSEEPIRSVPDELFQQVTRKAERQLPDALFGGPAAPAPPPKSAAKGDELVRTVPDELFKQVTRKAERHLPDALFGGPPPKPEAGSPEESGAVVDVLAGAGSAADASGDAAGESDADGDVSSVADAVVAEAESAAGTNAGDGALAGEAVDAEVVSEEPVSSGQLESDAASDGAAGQDVAASETDRASVADERDSVAASSGSGAEAVREDLEPIEGEPLSDEGEPDAAAVREDVEPIVGELLSDDPDPNAAEGSAAAETVRLPAENSAGEADSGPATVDGADSAPTGEAASVDSASDSGATAASAPASVSDSAAAAAVATLIPSEAPLSAASAESGTATAGEVVPDPEAAPAKRPVLLVIADSLSYFGPKGGLPADDPRIWPNLVGAELDWDVELVGRIGWTCRDAYWALIGDPRVWAAVPNAGAVVFAVGGMDTLPSPLPTALRELIRYVRPPGLRRLVRSTYNWLQPKLSKLGRPVALPPKVSVDYLEQSREALAQLRPDLPFVAVLPSVHKAEAYGRVHSGRPRAVKALQAWSARSAVPLVDLGEAVRENVFSGDANPDGIHWGWAGHTAVATAMVKTLQEVR